jgi:hypothetical protein
LVIFKILLGCRLIIRERENNTSHLRLKAPGSVPNNSLSCRAYHSYHSFHPVPPRLRTFAHLVEKRINVQTQARLSQDTVCSETEVNYVVRINTRGMKWVASIRLSVTNSGQNSTYGLICQWRFFIYEQ